MWTEPIVIRAFVRDALLRPYRIVLACGISTVDVCQSEIWIFKTVITRVQIQIYLYDVFCKMFSDESLSISNGIPGKG